MATAIKGDEHATETDEKARGTGQKDKGELTLATMKTHTHTVHTSTDGLSMDKRVFRCFLDVTVEACRRSRPTVLTKQLKSLHGEVFGRFAGVLSSIAFWCPPFFEYDSDTFFVLSVLAPHITFRSSPLLPCRCCLLAPKVLRGMTCWVAPPT